MASSPPPNSRRHHVLLCRQASPSLLWTVSSPGTRRSPWPIVFSCHRSPRSTISFTRSSSRSSSATRNRPWCPCLPLSMVEWCPRQLLSRWLEWFGAIGRFVLAGWAAPQPTLLGSSSRSSRRHIQIFNLKTSCFPRRVEMLWMLSRASNTTARNGSNSCQHRILVAKRGLEVQFVSQSVRQSIGRST